MLADFRAWLDQAAAGAAGDGAAAPPAEPVDLHTLLGQFLALRHEVNLQTRAVRAQQEQNAETLRQLTQALQALRQAPANSEDAEDAVRPLLKSLVDLHDALAPARCEAERISGAVLPDLDHLAESAAPPPAAPKRSFWSKLFGARRNGPSPAEEQRREARLAVEKVRKLLDSLVTGYGMSLQRLERALRQQGLEPIPCVGRPFDPEQMEAVEVVPDSGRPGGEVIDEVRRGYLWRGRVFRYAQVRVAKSEKSGVRSQESE